MCGVFVVLYISLRPCDGVGGVSYSFSTAYAYYHNIVSNIVFHRLLITRPVLCPMLFRLYMRNTLYEEHKQIVMTSDRKPSDMNTLEDRLKSRFEWGLIADIQPPDYETRMAILKNKAVSLGLDLSDDVCNYIAINVTNNVRQIEGTVKKIMAYRDLNNMPLDLANISRAIDDMFKAEGNALPTPSLIISQVCKFYSVDETVLRGTLKNKGTAEARQTAMYLIRKLTNLSLPDIGKEFARDHSTVLYAITKVEAELKQGNVTMQNNIRDITANINSLL